MMTGSQAFQVLGIDSSASPEEIKKAFRKKAAILHPDRNKAENAEDQFKELNEAYRVASAPPEAFGMKDFFQNEGDFAYNVEDVFRQFFDPPQGNDTKRVRFWSQSQRPTKIGLTLEEAANGCRKSVSLPGTQCEKCHGSGQEARHQECQRCGGKGKQGEHYCATCSGQGQVAYRARCSECVNQKGSTVEINFPSGISQGWKVQINGQVVVVYLLPHSELKTDGVNIFSVCELTLLEALKGCTKEVKTVKGKKKLKIPERRKQGDDVVAFELGLTKQGKHIFKMDIVYPEDLSKVIEALESDSLNKEEKDGI